MSTSKLIFKVENDNQLTFKILTYPNTSPDTDDIKINYIANNTNSQSFANKVYVSQENNKTLTNSLLQLKQQFESIIKFNSETLESVVIDIIKLFSDLQNADDAFNVINMTSPNKFGIYKKYAKYYYETLINREVKDDRKVWVNESSDSPEVLKRKQESFANVFENATILSDMVSWWYVRRLVHVYVVCTCLEKIMKMQQIQQMQKPVTTAYSSTYQPLATTTVVNPPVTGTIASTSATEIEQLKANYKKQLDAMQNYCNVVATDKTNINNQFAILQNDYNILNDKIKDQQNRIFELENNLRDYKDLLLESTGMIFKMNEIPNIK